MGFWLELILDILEIILILFIIYLILPKILEFIFRNHTATYIYNKKDFEKKRSSFSVQKNIPTLLIDNKTGNYTILFGQKRKLSDGSVKIYYNNTWYSSEPLKNEKKLIFEGVEEKISSDKLGKYRLFSLKWLLMDSDKRIITNFYQYFDSNFIIFEQKFPDEIDTGIGKFDIPITHFPRFINDSPNKRIFLFKNTIFSPPSSKKLPTSGPIMHYDDDLQSFIISPLNNFLVSIINETKKMKNYITCGLIGEIEKIPEDYSQKFILYFGVGINETFENWGKVLLKYYEKDRIDIYNDDIVSYLGYWTDNGAYYYYKTMRGKNYQETLETLVKYFKTEKIPIKYLQLDSWFYKKSRGPPIPLSLIILMNGIIDWSPNPKHFPDFEQFRQNIDYMPLACHSRYFHPKNVYSKRFKFFISHHRINKWALPAEVDVWDEMMQNARKNGIILYEQDWMKNQFKHFKILRNNVEMARKWLADMNKAAEKNDMWIQYCMATPAMFMQTLEFNRVSFVRTGNDYNARFPLVLYYPHNCETTILAHSLGILPFIDCIISNKTQGPFYKSPFPEILVLQAILSCGPVALGDRIGHIDKNLVLKTCRPDGLLLKPDRPATPIDLMFKKHSFYYTIKTYTEINNNKWYYCQIVNIWPSRVKSKSFTLSDLNIFDSMIIYDFFDKKAVRVNSNEPIGIELKKYKQKYYIIAPFLNNKIAIIGNPDKFITCSKVQFKLIEASEKIIKIIIKGIKNEVIPIRIYSEVKPIKIEINNNEIYELNDSSMDESWDYNEKTKILDINTKFKEDSEKNIVIHL